MSEAPANTRARKAAAPPENGPDAGSDSDSAGSEDEEKQEAR